MGDACRIIAVRRYANISAAFVHLEYYFHYGSHRCNLASDSELGEAIYCYTDVDTALKTLDYTMPEARKTCLGLVSVYLHEVENSKGRISLDSRSCKLLKFFAPFDTSLRLPMVLGEEDKLSLRINPFD